MIVDDQELVHNYLYHTHPHCTHMVGFHAARIIEELRGNGHFVKGDTWKKWLPEEYSLIDPGTGMMMVLDGMPSVLHQLDDSMVFQMIDSGW